MKASTVAKPCYSYGLNLAPPQTKRPRVESPLRTFFIEKKIHKNMGI